MNIWKLEKVWTKFKFYLNVVKEIKKVNKIENKIKKKVRNEEHYGYWLKWNRKQRYWKWMKIWNSHLFGLVKEKKKVIICFEQQFYFLCTILNFVQTNKIILKLKKIKKLKNMFYHTFVILKYKKSFDFIFILWLKFWNKI